MLATSTRPHHVVIVGAGFGGLAAARTLARSPTVVRVTIIDQQDFQTFQPLLFQVATDTLAPDTITADVGHLLRHARNVEFRVGRVTAIDTTARTVRLDEGSDVAYDSLVLAAGAVPNDYGIPGVQDHAFALKSLDDATALHDHVLRRIDELAVAPDDASRTFVVAGAGPTGVEIAGALSELLSRAANARRARRDATRSVGARRLPAGHYGAPRIVLVEPAGSILPPYAAASRAYAERALLARGVELRLGASLRLVDADGVVLDDGERIASRTVVWAAGVRAHPLATALGVPLGRGGRVSVTDALHLDAHPNVFVVGDMAGPVGGDGELPQVAQVAIQMGSHAARVIRKRLNGRTAPAFRYVDRGQMAIIGRGAGVVELGSTVGGARLRGVVAWLAWLALHLVYLPGMRNRSHALRRWVGGRAVATPRRGSQPGTFVRSDRSDPGVRWARGAAAPRSRPPIGR